MSARMPDWLAHRAAVLPKHPAVVFGAERLTYAELDRRATMLGRALVYGGIEPGDRVALLAGNSLEFVESVHAVPRAGGILVLVVIAGLQDGYVASRLEDGLGLRGA